MEFIFGLSGFVTLVAVAALAARWRPQRRWPWRLLLLVISFYALVTTYGVPYAFSRLLVRGYAPLMAPVPATGRTVIVVMGAGELPVRAWDGTVWPKPNASGVARVVEARRVYGLYQDAIIISSGGASSGEATAPTSGASMRDALVLLGVPPSRILVEDRSRNTREEALQIGPMLASLQPERVVLVTSDIHMWRSLGAFRAAGIDAVPAIARDPFFRFGWRFWAIPKNDGLTFSGAVAHEVVGLAYYAVRGWLK